MTLWSRLAFVWIAALFLPLTESTVAAKSLTSNLSDLSFSELDKKRWQVISNESDALQINCVSCEEQILVNVLLSGREFFGLLGEAKAQKAKENCFDRSDGSLQCDTIEGFDMGAVSGLISTVKVTEDFFVSSYILGDNDTLIQIRAKAPTSESATFSVKTIYKALEAGIIIQ